MSFDAAKHGLETHYNESSRQTLQEMILEDWKDVGVKLPTYMKLLARFISPEGVPEEWLSKLRHQTMDTMLKGISTPRYEFWACIHLYLNKKHGYITLGNRISDEDMLGIAFEQFTGVKKAPKAAVYPTHGKELVLIEEEDKAYSLAYANAPEADSESFSLDVDSPLKGVAIQQKQKITTILRDTMTREMFVWEIRL